MDEGWDEPAAGPSQELAGSVVFRTQREVDVIFARLRAWRDRDRTV